ncbi:MAG: hypothetical protein GX382_10285 [Syntrophomonadaceae bacterium]|nr:hypothetical protein [Syntrophomonadaceae bacterium]
MIFRRVPPGVPPSSVQLQNRAVMTGTKGCTVELPSDTGKAKAWRRAHLIFLYW